MKPEHYAERNAELAGWPVHVVSYKLGERFLCKVDNVSPGAQIAKGEGPTREAAEEEALETAKRRLERTRRVPAG